MPVGKAGENIPISTAALSIVDDSLIIIFVLHVRNIVIILNDLPFSNITRIVHCPYLAHLQGLAT